MQKWATGDRTADDLFYITRTSMPFGAPQLPRAQEYADLVAFILRENGYAAGPTELRPDPAALAGVQARASGRRERARAPRDRRAPVSTASAPMGGPTQEEFNRAGSDRSSWLHLNHDYNGQRFVDSVRITRENVASLAPVCIYQFGDTNTFHTNRSCTGRDVRDD